MADKQRLDAALVARGLAGSRERAKEYIAAGRVTVNGTRAAKAAQPVGDDDEILCEATEKYVGRGGYKLEKALTGGRFDLRGRVAMDVGASTGGFTQCLLEYGAEKVFAVDVGRDQLHPTLRADARVCSLESTDVRDRDKMHAAVADESIEFCSVDVSFISLKLVLPAVRPYLKPGADVVCLIKPQFEAGRAAVGKHGVVKDEKEHRRVLHEVLDYAMGCGLQTEHLTGSPIRGGDGNAEYLAVFRYVPNAAVTPPTEALIEAALREIRDSAE